MPANFLSFEIHQLPALRDNYIYVLQDKASGVTACVDPAEAEPVVEFLEQKGWPLDYILNTHHHMDHVGGNKTLKARYHCTIIGSEADRDRIPKLDQAVGHGDTINLNSLKGQVVSIPGHTRGHVAYYFEAQQALFCGDTLFSLGCGRLFEGTPAQMLSSLNKIKDLPPATKVYCGHEYTLKNTQFALSVEPGNSKLQDKLRNVKKLRNDSQATVPSTLEEELALNPFLRTNDTGLRQSLGLEQTPEEEVLAELRRRRDVF